MHVVLQAVPARPDGVARATRSRGRGLRPQVRRPERAAAIIDQVTAVAAEDGIEFRMDRALRANTFDAHRLLWLAARHAVTRRR